MVGGVIRPRVREAEPFHFGQVFEYTENGVHREAIVLHTRNNGQEALLRYVDTRVEEWVRWPEFDEARIWCWIGSER
jgi:hypothetical protein